jgi:hypothetical protein
MRLLKVVEAARDALNVTSGTEGQRSKIEQF